MPRPHQSDSRLQPGSPAPHGPHRLQNPLAEPASACRELNFRSQRFQLAVQLTLIHLQIDNIQAIYAANPSGRQEKEGILPMGVDNACCRRENSGMTPQGGLHPPSLLSLQPLQTSTPASPIINGF